MAKYVDLSQIASGSGTSGDPYNYSDIKLYAPGILEDIFVKGSFEGDTTVGYYGLLFGTNPQYKNIKRWINEPWRIRNTSISGASFTIGGHLLSGGIIEQTDTAPITGGNGSDSTNIISSCIIIHRTGQININQNFAPGTAIIKGNVFICNIFNTTASGPGSPLYEDNIIISNTFSTVISDAIWNNNAFTVSIIGKSGVWGTSGQANQGLWSASIDPTTAPAWDAAESSWLNSTLGTGITTPPEPGNPPYTDYATDPWGNARTGIGAFSFVPLKVAEDSNVVSAEFIIAVDSPVIIPDGGTYENNISVSLSAITSDSQIYYSIDDSDPTSATGTLYSVPFEISENATVKAVGVKDGMEDSTIASAGFEIQCADPVIMPDGGTYTGSTSISMSANTPGSSIYYTLDGGIPTSADMLYSVPFEISANATIKAITVKNNLINSNVTSSSPFSIKVQTPTLFPTAGSYEDNVDVSATDSTPDSQIYYTLDGGTPTSASNLYSGPFELSATTTVKAVGVKDGMTNSSVASSLYTIVNEMVDTPVITPDTGSGSTPLLVTLSCPTPDVSIYYTSNGQDPTVHSNLYTAPFYVFSRIVLKVKAFKSGMVESNIAQAIYEVEAPKGNTNMESIQGFEYDGNGNIKSTTGRNAMYEAYGFGNVGHWGAEHGKKD